TVAVTPCGRSTGFFATLDMQRPSGNHAQDFAALADRTRLTVRHDALRSRDDRDAEAAEHLRQRGLAAVRPQARAADALDPVDDRAAVVILQLHRQRRLAAVGRRREAGDVALVA